MQEAPAAHETFARVLAEDDAVDAGKIGALVAPGIGRGSAELAGIGERVADPLGRRRMRRQEIRRPRIDGTALLLRLELGIVLHRSEEAHRAVGIVTGARGDADADGVGFELLRPREARQRELRLGERQRALLRIGDHVADHPVHQRGLPRLLLADGGVARDHVAHLVGEHRRKLGFIVGERNKAARHVELPGGKREGVDRLRIEHRDLVVQVGPLRRRHQVIDGLLDHALQPRVVVDAAIRPEDALVLAQRRRRHVLVDRLRRSRQRHLRRKRGRRRRARR